MPMNCKGIREWIVKEGSFILTANEHQNLGISTASPYLEGSN